MDFDLRTAPAYRPEIAAFLRHGIVRGLWKGVAVGVVGMTAAALVAVLISPLIAIGVALVSVSLAGVLVGRSLSQLNQVDGGFTPDGMMSEVGRRMARQTGEVSGPVDELEAAGDVLTDERLGAELVGAGVVDQATLSRAQMRGASLGLPLLGALRREGVTQDDLVRFLAQWSGYRYIEADALTVDGPATGLLPPELATELRAVALTVEDGELVVAFADPEVVHGVERVSEATGYSVRPVIALPTAIAAGLARSGITLTV
jgi:hypothetical protein